MADQVVWDRGFLALLRSRLDEAEVESVSEFAERIGVSHVSLWSWLERGVRPSFVTLGKIAGPMGVDVGELRWLAGYNVPRLSPAPEPDRPPVNLSIDDMDSLSDEELIDRLRQTVDALERRRRGEG